MTVSACPIAVVNAPPERVWELLSRPANYDRWWDAKTVAILPEGPAQAGQKVNARANGFNILLTVDGVDEANRQIHFTTKYPFGITGFNHITCTPLSNSTTQVSFG
jgi:ligand-binding SRPBCC domain-containing protein